MRRTAWMLCLAFAVVLSNGSGRAASASGPYRNAELGFSYTPPNGLRGATTAAEEAESTQLRNRTVQFVFLLRMVSGQDDSASDWCALGIATYPRGRDKDKGDDLTAGFFTNHALIGGKANQRAGVNLGGREFSMTSSEINNGSKTKYAVAYTTVQNEKFLSFFFLGNDPERVKKIAESINTVKFSARE